MISKVAGTMIDQVIKWQNRGNFTVWSV